ncbi:MAG TPA: hypothetical protein VFM98_09665 [Ramlibacter sp.]|uniref:hypothetical protein n=1 Tax=Ramlibacter sp. TaxID=1917967 RepID=UPI002D7EA104|nr:hypothetical protein [Ramlibacter sp.]HET8745863.1 hypothetical protein [Ramlibacter sp.]
MHLRVAATVLSAGLLLAACASPKEPVGDNRCYPRADGAQCITQPPRALGLLAGGTPVTVRVDARCEWNPTGVILQRGERYRVAVTKVVEPWGGGPRFLSEGGRHTQRWARASALPMHALVGAQGREEKTFFPVGPQATFTAASGEELLFFSNTWPGYFEANRGCVEVEIQRIGG